MPSLHPFCYETNNITANLSTKVRNSASMKQVTQHLSLCNQLIHDHKSHLCQMLSSRLVPVHCIVILPLTESKGIFAFVYCDRCSCWRQYANVLISSFSALLECLQEKFGVMWYIYILFSFQYVGFIWVPVSLPLTKRCIPFCCSWSPL